MVNGHGQSQTDPLPSPPSFDFVVYQKCPHPGWVIQLATFAVFGGVIVLWVHGLVTLTWLMFLRSSRTLHSFDCPIICTCDPHVTLIVSYIPYFFCSYVMYIENHSNVFFNIVLFGKLIIIYYCNNIYFL